MGGPALAEPWQSLVGAAAVLSVAAACLGRIWCSAYIAGRKDAALVTIGPYARCRHPLYAWSLLAGLGLGLATRSLLLTAATLLLLAVLFVQAIRDEEARLRSQFGAAFDAYARSTPLLWPRRIGPSAGAAAAIVLEPVLFRKAFLDAGAMLLLVILIETASRLRAAGWLPTLLQLP
ncbi:MAG: hypothetical protein NZM12_13445 [Steroidobacteraceae bacterium]|nr:hypothetical protein [Steroidobacteraceae bacterium]MDW8259826.1 isoprenylcysteine carboxylmethyltransferase family protein [Gammaproteobacteria bacterium]